LVGGGLIGSAGGGVGGQSDAPNAGSYKKYKYFVQIADNIYSFGYLSLFISFEPAY